MKTRVTKEWCSISGRFLFYVSQWVDDEWAYGPFNDGITPDWPPFDTQAEAEVFAFNWAKNAPGYPRGVVVVVAEFYE
jgi:hypothetical protein